MIINFDKRKLTGFLRSVNFLNGAMYSDAESNLHFFCSLSVLLYEIIVTLTYVRDVKNIPE